MENSLATYFNPTCSVAAPPEIFLTSDWYPKVLQRIESFVRGFQKAFGMIDVYDWYRVFREQEKLFGGGSSKAAVSEHNFAAALDLEIPEKYHEKNTVDFISKLSQIDTQVRIGWRDYQKPNKQFTFCHVGWGFIIPYEVIKKYIDTYFAEPQATKIYQNINRCWQPGVQW
jgi:hypothetical protein